MNKSTLPTGVRTLLGWISKGTLRLDAEFQRASGQWTNLQQSLLIHSIFYTSKNIKMMMGTPVIVV